MVYDDEIRPMRRGMSPVAKLAIGGAVLVGITVGGYIAYKQFVEPWIVSLSKKDEEKDKSGAGTGITPACDPAKGIVVNCTPAIYTSAPSGTTGGACYKDDDCKVTYAGQVNICDTGVCIDCTKDAGIDPIRVLRCAARAGQVTTHQELGTPNTPSAVAQYCAGAIASEQSTVDYTVARNAAQGSPAIYIKTVCNPVTNTVGNIIARTMAIAWQVKASDGSTYGMNTATDETPYEYCQKQPDPTACRSARGLPAAKKCEWWQIFGC